MADILIDSEWYKDAKGFRLVPWNSLDSSAQRPGDCIVANGGKWIPYRPLERFDSLYVVFANVKTSAELLEFINNFGPLTPVGFASGELGPEPIPGGATWGDDVSYGLRQARLFREILLRQGRPRALGRFLRSELHAEEVRAHNEAYERAEKAAPETIEVDPTWPSIPPVFDLIVDSRRGIQLRLRTPRAKIEPTLFWLNIPIAAIDLVPDPESGVRLRLNTDSLINAMWWQLGRQLSGNTLVRQCRHCRTLFTVGQGTGRRADATFCCNEHSVRFHSVKRSRKG
jgi:hypothetical protein